MKNIRKDLIEKELDWNNKTIKDYKYVKLSNRVIDNILNHYDVWEITEHFYDAYPGTYGLCDEYSFKDLLPKYNDECDEYKIYYEAFEKLISVHPEYLEEVENIRMEFNNWIDVDGPGIWGMTQQKCNKWARDLLKVIRNVKDKEDRIYFYKDEKLVHVYVYGRDINYSDWHFVFKNKEIE